MIVQPWQDNCSSKRRRDEKGDKRPAKMMKKVNLGKRAMNQQCELSEIKVIIR